ncbi:MAG: MBL fold metallo-hydrolase [Planctomycetota bacterium]
MSDPRYSFSLLRAGRLLLDGGGMFGLIPKVVWSRTVECDDRNRIELHHNCLLLMPSEGGGKPVLIEAGTGDKLDEKMAKIFGLDGRTVEAAVRERGVEPSEIGHAIISHLHFDHAGGLTRRPRDGESPDWSASEPGDASGDAEGVVLTFPNAEVIVQEREWRDALANDAVMTRTYYRDHLLPLSQSLPDGRARLRLIDSPPPFADGLVPHRKELPPEDLESRWTEVLPGIRVFRTPGHTWGQQAVQFTDESGRQIVFTPDLMPTAWHSGAAYSLAYDVEPYTSMVTKRWFLHEASERGWTLVLDHEPGAPLRTVEPDGKGWFRLIEAG